MRNTLSRREFLGAAAGGVLAGACGSSAAQRQPDTTAVQGGRILLRGGCVLSLDPKVGDFETADVLIEGSRIAAVGPNLEASATVLDASHTIVMPGFIDTHRHMWQGVLRNSLPNGVLNDYMRDILGVRPLMRPDDVRIGDLVSALGAINAGVTTVLDWSHIGNTPEHTDAAIDGLRASGVRAVYGFGAGVGASVQYPNDIRRLRKQHFSSPDQLLTLTLAGGMSASEWAVARDVGAPISVHAGGTLAGLEKSLGPDVTYIHCTTFTGAAWKLVAGSGGHVSIACPVEMQMGLGVPPIQQSLDHGIRPSLSVDVETEMPGDMFTQMRSVFTLQRMLALNPTAGASRPQPRLLTVRDVVEFATIAGARANQLDRKVGTLTPGKEADVIMLRTDAINVMPLNNASGAVVLAMDTSNVDTVFIGGRVMKQGGRLVGVDLNRIRQDAERSRDYVAGKAGWKKTLVL
jgi:cytosine/adenosine deaminase-related metal-dependent hydrolase